MENSRAGSVLQKGPPTPSSSGRGRLRVARVGDRSVVTQAYATSPLRLLTPRNHGHAAWVYTSTFGGGMVDGDCIEIDVDVAAGATVYVSTQAATKLYKSPHGAKATMRSTIGPGALLCVLPDPVICFADARYRQVQRFDLAEDAGLVALDWMVGGRRASGERWAFTEYHSRNEVAVGGRRLVYDPVALRASDGDLRSRLGRFDVLATVVVAGKLLDAEATSILASAGDRPLTRGADELIAVSPLADGLGCIVRIAGTSAEAVGSTLRRLLRFVPARLGDDPWRRKW